MVELLSNFHLVLLPIFFTSILFFRKRSKDITQKLVIGLFCLLFFFAIRLVDVDIAKEPLLNILSDKSIILLSYEFIPFYLLSLIFNCFLAVRLIKSFGSFNSNTIFLFIVFVCSFLLSFAYDSLVLVSVLGILFFAIFFLQKDLFNKFTDYEIITAFSLVGGSIVSLMLEENPIFQSAFLMGDGVVSISRLFSVSFVLGSFGFISYLFFKKIDLLKLDTIFVIAFYFSLGILKFLFTVSGKLYDSSSLLLSPLFVMVFLMLALVYSMKDHLSNFRFFLLLAITGNLLVFSFFNLLKFYQIFSITTSILVGIILLYFIIGFLQESESNIFLLPILLIMGFFPGTATFSGLKYLFISYDTSLIRISFILSVLIFSILLVRLSANLNQFSIAKDVMVGKKDFFIIFASFLCFSQLYSDFLWGFFK